MNIYTYSLIKIDSIQLIDEEQIKTLKDLGNLMTKTIVDALFVIIYLILVVALFMALFVRGTRLWLYAMFSPVF